MTQADALKILKKKRKWMTSKEVSRILRVSTASASLRKLWEQGDILRRKIKNKRRLLLYQYKKK